MKELDELDRRLLNIIQTSIPLVERPFLEIGRETGLSERDVILRLRRAKKLGIIREISAVVDPRRLGYRTTLVAVLVDDEHVDELGWKISENPYVSHNYKRNHAFNLWFTLSYQASTRVEEMVEAMVQHPGVQEWLILPAIRFFKLNAHFNMTPHQPNPQPSPSSELNSEVNVEPLTPTNISVIKSLQRELEIVPLPFDDSAQAIGLSTSEFLHQARVLLEKKVLKRFAGALRHRKAGYAANGMACWRVHEDLIRKVGYLAASYPQVSHCYQRRTYPNWPYNLFTMIHGSTQAMCQSVVDDIAARSGVDDYIVLYSVKEYKKERTRYFTD